MKDLVKVNIFYAIILGLILWGVISIITDNSSPNYYPEDYTPGFHPLDGGL